MSTRDREPVSTSRTTRTTSRGLARREQILGVATTMFLAHGYAGVSIDEIVKAVGGSKTNVYSQFGSKEGLFSTLVEALCADLLRDFQAMDLEGMELAQGLKTLASTLLAILLEERHLAFQRLIIAESGRFPALARVWLDSGPQQSRRIIARFLEARQRAGQLRVSDAMRAATLFHDMVVSNPTHLAMLGAPPSARDIDQFIDDVIDTFLHGHATQPGPARTSRAQA